MYILYLDLPNIPEDLLETIEEIINKPRSKSIVTEDYFQTRPINKNLEVWLEKNLPFDFAARYQIILPGLPIHKDKGNRKRAYNYLLSLGGNNVKTIIFDESFKKIQEEILPLKTWHSIETDRYHGVLGIQPATPRIALSITPSL